MTALTPKYIVRKIIDNEPGEDVSEGKPLPQGEFFVLRKQDLLAVHALWAYIGVLRVATDLVSGEGFIELSNLADAVSDLANEWEEAGNDRKLPD